MKISKKWIKKAISLFLIAKLNINTFGAIVSDNDASAFITKAEFDALNW